MADQDIEMGLAAHPQPAAGEQQPRDIDASTRWGRTKAFFYVNIWTEEGYYIFWILIYVLSFTLFWVSLYYNEDYQKSMKANISKQQGFRILFQICIGCALLVATGPMLVITGYALYFLMYLCFVKCGLATKLTIVYICRFLAGATIPVGSAYMGHYLTGLYGLLLCIGAAGVIFSLQMIFGKITLEYGISDAFIAVVLGILVGVPHGKYIWAKCLVFTVFSATRYLFPLISSKCPLVIDRPPSEGGRTVQILREANLPVAVRG